MIRATVVALALVAATAVAAHDLRVFASVSGQEVAVEAKFSSGRVPAGGEVRVFDGADTLVMTLPVGEGGVTTFALPDGAAETGLRIEVEAGDGHSDYWLLTPDDIAHGQATN
jgi:nickel transport protein